MTAAHRIARLPSVPSRRRDSVSPSLLALLNRHLAKNAERDNPPTGRFLEVDGVRIHYVERGAGDPLVLLHGKARRPT